MAEHARLSASQAPRWMACPASVGLTANLPKQPSSHAANEGTAAHELAAMCLIEGRQPIEMVGRIITVEDKDLGLKEDFEVDEEMSEAVTVYTDYIAKQLANKPDAKFYVEKRFDLTWLRPNMFGTNDASIFEPKVELLIGDYKHGKGVIVEPENNEQLMYYGLGGLRTALPWDKALDPTEWLKHPDMPKQVRLVIIQPRARHKKGPIRDWVISTEELWEWRIKLAFAADETLKENPTVKSGKHCRWCQATGICPELRGEVQRQAQMDFGVLPSSYDETVPDQHRIETDPVIPIDPVDLAKAMNALPVVEMWCRGVGHAAQAYLESGNTLPGFKLVKKKTNRKWDDETETQTELATLLNSESDYLTEPKLKGPAQVEKLKVIGKDWVKVRCHKPDGLLTVAPDIDPRPEVTGPSTALFEAQPLDIELTEEDIFG